MYQHSVSGLSPTLLRWKDKTTMSWLQETARLIGPKAILIWPWLSHCEEDWVIFSFLDKSVPSSPWWSSGVSTLSEDDSLYSGLYFSSSLSSGLLLLYLNVSRSSWTSSWKMRWRPFGLWITLLWNWKIQKWKCAAPLYLCFHQRKTHSKTYTFRCRCRFISTVL